jgi:cell division protein FtsQ
MTGTPAQTATQADEAAVDGEVAGAAGADTDGLDPAQRAARSRRRRRRIAGVAAVGFVATWWVGWGSPATLVEHVVVSAPRGISEESVRLASGISAQDHVPAVQEDEVREAIMAALPAVADVDVTRSLPSTIRVEVTARTPMAAVVAGKGFHVMDAEGVLYDKVKSAKRLPVIRARTDVGREAARVVLLAVPEDLRKKVKRVSAKTRDDVTLTLRGGSTVRWGSPEDSALKAQVLAGLSAVNARKYDVSVPLLPTTSRPIEEDED